jgi:transposase
MKKSKVVVTITEEEKGKLNKIAKGQKSERRQVLRSIIILLLGQGNKEKGVSKELGINIKTVRKWRDRFVQKGMEGLEDSARSGAPGSFSVIQRCEVISIACDHPRNYGYDTHNYWNTNILTEAVNKSIDGLNMARSSVVRTLNLNELKPHKHKMWLHSKDSEFKEKVNEIVDLYIDPPEDAAVVSIDEKTGMQATERKYETKLPSSGQTGKYEYEYIRHGTQSLIAAFDIKTGKVIAECGKTRTAEDLLSFMENLAQEYRHEKQVHIIWDNLNIHKDGSNERWIEFNKRHGEKFEFHYTPKHASWVNQVEIFFSILHKRCLKLGSFRSEEELREMVMKFIRIWNDKDKHPFNWTFRGYPMQSKEKEYA